MTPIHGDRVAVLIKTFDKHWNDYRAVHKRCRSKFSSATVHDLRVAARRMLAFIQLLKRVVPSPRLKKLSRAFKHRLHALDDLRDTQVMLAEIAAALHKLPQLEKLQNHLLAVQQQLLQVSHRKIKVADLSRIAKRMRKTRKVLKKTADRLVDARLLQAVDAAFLTALQRYNQIDSAQPSTIHHTRIAFKNFRYLVEIVQPLLHGFPVDNLKQMHDYQSLMGEVQDAEVFIHALADFSEQAFLPEIAPIQHYYAQRHANAISTYVNHMDQIKNFWRTAPDQPFPWEKLHETLPEKTQRST